MSTRYSSERPVNGSAYDLAAEANTAFNRRQNAAAALAAVVGIIGDAEVGYYDERKAAMGPDRFDQYWQQRKSALEGEIEVAAKEFRNTELTAAESMPAVQEAETVEY
jgi:hypothetical protein